MHTPVCIWARSFLSWSIRQRKKFDILIIVRNCIASIKWVFIQSPKPEISSTGDGYRVKYCWNLRHNREKNVNKIAPAALHFSVQTMIMFGAGCIVKTQLPHHIHLPSYK